MNILSGNRMRAGSGNAGYQFSELKKAAALAICSAVLLASAGCSKKEEKKAEGPGSGALSTKAAEVVVPSGLVNQIPETSVGYLTWDLSSDAYKKLKNSPWKTKAGGNLAATLTALEKDSAVFRVLDKVFDLKKTASAAPGSVNDSELLFAKGVGFVVPPPPGGTEPSLGLLFESSAGDLGGKAGALKEALKAEKVEVSDLTLGEGQGFKFQVKDSEVKDLNLPMGVQLPEDIKPQTQPGKPVDLFFAWKGNRGTFASNERLAGTLLSTKPDKTPAVSNKPLFIEATKGLAKSSDQLFFGYFDVEEAAVSMPEAAASANAGETGKPQPLAAADIPVRAIAGSFSMSDAPENRLNIVTNTANLKFKPWLGALQNSSNSTMLTSVPGSPMILLTLDGKTVSALKAQALAMAPEEDPTKQMISQQIAFLDDIGRFGIAVKMGALGQSLMPIPDILIVAQSAQPEVTKEKLTGMIGMGMATSGLPDAPWADKEISGVKAKYMLTPFGLGAFVASVNDMVIVSSTEAQLSAVLEGVKSGKGAFAEKLNSRAKDVLSVQPSVGTVYINFTEIAGLVESLGGMMQMYAPQGQGGQMLDQAQLESLRQMGTMVVSISSADGIVSLRSFYEPPVSAGAPPA